jgi:hypothetical protein
MFDTRTFTDGADSIQPLSLQELGDIQELGDMRRRVDGDFFLLRRPRMIGPQPPIYRRVCSGVEHVSVGQHLRHPPSLILDVA